MTSKISFRRLLREDLKKRMWVAALFGVLFLIIIPLMMLFQIEERLGNAQIIGPDQLQITLEWFQRMMGLDNILMIAPVMLGAVLSGVSSFSYLHSKSQTDFYHSLPVQRKTWFFVTYAGSVIQVIVPYLLGCLMIGVIGKVKGVAAPGVFRQMPEVIGITVLFFLLLYAVTAVSMLLTGKILTALAGVLVLSFWGSAVYALRIYLMTQAFETYMSEGRYYGFLGNIFGEASWLSPIMAYGKLLDDYRPGSKLKILSVLAVCVLAFSAAAYLLYQFRPSEAAGKAIAFPKAEPVIQVILSVTVGILFGTIVGSQNRSVGMHAGWLFGIGTLAAALSSAVIEFIYHADLKLIFKKRLPLAASVLGTVLVLASVQYDWFGYNTYLPDRGKIRSMAVDSIRVREWTGSTNVHTKGKYKEFLKTLRRDEFDRIYELAQSGMEKIGTDEAGEYVNMAYFLKNGRTVYRSYRVDENFLWTVSQNFWKTENIGQDYFRWTK